METNKCEISAVEQEAGKLLGKNVAYKKEYNPDILVPFSRKKSLESCNVDPNAYDWYGFDLWNLYEVRFKHSVPVESQGYRGRETKKGTLNYTTAYVGKLIYDAHSEYIIESKSMKLYTMGQVAEKLNSQKFIDRFKTDIAARVKGSYVDFKLYRPYDITEQTIELAKEYDYQFGDIQINKVHRLLVGDKKTYTTVLPFSEPIKVNSCSEEKPSIFDLLTMYEEVKKNCESLLDADGKKLLQVVTSPSYAYNRLRAFVYFAGSSNCLVTKQKDYCTDYILIESDPNYIVRPISLQLYLEAFEDINRFHESTAHTIFDRLVSVMREKDPNAHVTVISFYTRRGGIDIVPVRTTKFDNYVKLLEYFTNNPYVKTWNQ